MANNAPRAASRKSLDMTQGGIVSKVVAFAIPLLIGNLFQQMYLMADSVIVGRFFDHTALSAVGSAGVPVQIFLALFLGIGTGATILVSQYVGAGDRESIKKAMATANSFMLISAVPLTIIGLILAPFLLKMMNVPDDVYPQALLYLQMLFFGTFASLGYNMNAGVLRGMGNSRPPLYFLMASVVANIFFDLFFIVVLKQGMWSIGLATVIAQLVSWGYSVIYIKKHHPELEFKVFRISFDKNMLKHMVRLGLPLGFNNAIFALGFLFLNSLINSQGSIFMAGTTAAGRVDNLIFLPVTSFAAAATTFAGQNVGAGKHDRLRKGFWQILGVTLASNIALTAVVLLTGRYLLGMFTTDPAVIEVGMNVIWWIAPWYWTYNIFAICNNYMNGAGEVRVPTISSLIMFWGVRLPMAYLFFNLFGKDYIYAAYPLSWAAGAIISGAYYLSGRWKRHYQSRAGDNAPAPGEQNKPMRTHVYFIRHAQAMIDGGVTDSSLRELTEKGAADSLTVADFLEKKGVTRLFSSPMRRAVATVTPYAARKELNIELIDALEERKITGWIEDFDDFARRQWQDFDYKPEGCESLREAQARYMEALTDIIARCPGQTVAAGCHGTALAAMVNHFKSGFGHEDFLGMVDKTPWAVRITFDGAMFEEMEFIDLV